MSYAKMALVYDILMEDAPYDKWEQFATSIIERYGKNIKTMADLGCGTGQITRRLAKRGFKLIGVDNAQDMLTYAEQAATEEHLSIQWFNQDLRSLEGFNNIDAVVSFCDVINYITEQDEVKQVFRNVNDMLRDNGLFLFDVHSINHVEEDLKGQTFAEIYDDISYVLLCQAGSSIGEVYHDLTFFVLDEHQYDRFDETHHQRTFSIDTYKSMLSETGFQLKGLYCDFSTDHNMNVNDGQRLFFVCEKIRGC